MSVYLIYIIQKKKIIIVFQEILIIFQILIVIFNNKLMILIKVNLKRNRNNHNNNKYLNIYDKYQILKKCKFHNHIENLIFKYNKINP